MALDPYTRRVLAARRVHLALDARAMDELVRLIERAANDLARGIAGLPETDRRAVAERIARRVYADLDRRLQALVEQGVRVQFTEIKRIMDEATYQEIRRVTGTNVRVLFQPVPPADAAASFLAREGVAHTFRSLSVAVQGAANGVEDLTAEALTQQWSPERLAQKMRRYVRGQEAFTASELEDLRRVPHSRRQAVKDLQRLTRRIAITEMGNAAHEAQVQSMIEAPQVEAAIWRLSPVRGTQQGKPDECDILAVQDIYGMGRGVFPVERIPVRPHPNDRCWLQSKTRPPSQWGRPKPTGNVVNRPTAEGVEELTPNAQERAIASARRAIQAGIEGDRQRRSEIRARGAA